MTTSDLDPLFDQLRQAQLQFADLIKDFQTHSSKDTGDDAEEPWSAPLRVWWDSAKKSAQPEVSSLFEKLIDHGQVLFQVAERLNQTANTSGHSKNRELLALLEQLQISLGESLVPRATGADTLFSPMGHLLDSWRNHASKLMGISDPLGANAKGVGSLDAWTHPTLQIDADGVAELLQV